MPVVCWGALGKSANDPTTIDEEINAYIQEHNVNINAHGLNGYALYIHRSWEIIDHADYSVINSKILDIARAYTFIVDLNGDGDFTDIQSAIDAAHSLGGGKILILDGTYNLSSSLVLYDNIQLIGQDDDSTIINFNGNDIHIEVIGTFENYINNVSFYNLKICGMRSATKSALYLEYAKNCQIQKCQFSDNYDSVGQTGVDIELDLTESIEILNCRFLDSGSSILCETSLSSFITFNYFYNASLVCISLAVPSNMRIIGNLFEDCQDSILNSIDDVGEIVFSENVVNSAVNNCIDLATCEQSIFSNNIFHGSSDSGKCINFGPVSDNNIIHSNVMMSFRDDCISLYRSTYNEIGGNFIAWNYGYAVRITDQASHRNLIINNLLKKNLAGDFLDQGVDNRFSSNYDNIPEGWEGAFETWTYASADDPTYTLTIAGDKTKKYTPGMRVRLTQTTDKYFIITKVVYSSPNTTLTLYGGTDYDLANAVIVNPCFSSAKCPPGFPYDISKWSVQVKNTSEYAQSSPTQNAWYNLGSISIDIPIGLWDLFYQATFESQDSSNATWVIFGTLSTANNSESDSEMTVFVSQGNHYYNYLTAFRRKPAGLNLSSKATYYLNEKTSISGQDNIILRGDLAPTMISAVCAYL